jgi:foldase protein PrsA
MSLAQFKQLILPKVALEKIRDEKFVKVKARHIVVKDENKAKELEKKIRDGAKFEDVAKDNSEDQATKDSGGQLAEGDFIYKELSGLPEEIENELFKLKAGEMSGVVKSSLGCHLLKVDERQGYIDTKPTQWYEDLKKQYPIGEWI